MTSIFDLVEKKVQQLSLVNEKEDALNITEEDLHNLFLSDKPIFIAQQHLKGPPTDEQLEELLCRGKKVRDFELILIDRDHSEIAAFAVQELCYLANENDGFLWTKSPIDGTDILDKHHYQQTFPRSNSISEGSRAFAVVNMEPMRLAHELTTGNKRRELFPTIVLEEITIRVLFNGSSLDNPDGSLQLIYTELQATTPLVPKRSFVFLRTCKQIDQSTWVVADILIEPFGNIGFPYGCWIQRTAEGLSKVIWVEHLVIEAKYCTFGPIGFAFGAERWVACLERSCERKSYEMQTLPGGDLCDYQNRYMMLLGQRMVHAFCQIICPTIDDHPWSFVTGDNRKSFKIYATLRKSPYYDDPKDMVIVVTTTFHLPQSPEFVLEILRDERKRHEWDLSGRPKGLREVGHYTTGKDPKNHISVYEIDESSSHQILQETSVNRSGSLVVWSVAKHRKYDGGEPISLPLNTLSGFAISANSHQNTTSGSSNIGGGSLVTLGVQLRAVGSKPLDELDPKAMPMDFINKYIRETISRIVLLLDKESACGST